jgi:hypothetical protein
MIERRHFTAEQDPERDTPVRVEQVATVDYSPNLDVSERVAMWLWQEKEAGRNPSTKEIQDKAREFAKANLVPNATPRASDALLRLRYLHAVVRMNGGNPDGTSYEQLMDLLAMCEKPVPTFEEWSQIRWPQTPISQPS